MDKRKLLFEGNLKNNFQDFNYEFLDNKPKLNDIKIRDETYKRVNVKQPYEANDKLYEMNTKTNSSFTIHSDNDVSNLRKKIEDLQLKVDTQDAKLKAREKQIQHQQSQIKQYVFEINQMQLMEQDYKEQIISLNNELTQWKDKYFVNLKEYQYKLASLTRKATQDQNSQKERYEEIIHQKQKEIEQIELRFENERDHLYKAIELQNKPQNINNEINELITKYDELETENMALREKILVFEANQDELKFHIQQISGKLLEQVNKNVQIEQQKQQEIQNCQNQLQAKDKQIDNLLIQIEESKNEEQYLDQEKLMQLENLNNQLIEQNSQLEDENQKLKLQISDKLEQEKLNIQQYQQQTLQLQQEIYQQKQQIDQFELQQVNDTNVISQEQKVQIDDLLFKLNKLEHECEQLKQKNNVLATNLSESQNQSKQKEELIEQIESYEKDIKEKDEVIQSQRSNQKDFEKVIAQYRSENKEYKSKNELLTNQNEIYTFQIEEMLKEKQNLQKQIETLIKDNNSQKQEFQKIKQQNDNEQINNITNQEAENLKLQLQNTMLQQQLVDIMEEFKEQSKLYQNEIINKKLLYDELQLKNHEKDLYIKQLEDELALNQEQSQQLLESIQILQKDKDTQEQQQQILKQQLSELQDIVSYYQNQSKNVEESNNTENFKEVQLQLIYEKELNANLNLQLQDIQEKYQKLQEEILESQIKIQKEEFQNREKSILEAQIKQMQQQLSEQRILNDELLLVKQDYQSIKDELNQQQSQIHYKDQEIQNQKKIIKELEEQDKNVRLQQNQIIQLKSLNNNLEIELERSKNEFEYQLNQLKQEKDNLISKTIEAIQEKVILENKLQKFEEELLQKQLQISRIDPNQIAEPYDNEYSNNFEIDKSPNGKEQQNQENKERQQLGAEFQDQDQIREDLNLSANQQKQEFELNQYYQIPLIPPDLKDQYINSFENSSQKIEQLQNQDNFISQNFQEFSIEKEDQTHNNSKQHETFKSQQQETNKKVDLNLQQQADKEMLDEEPSNISITSQELADTLINNVLNGAIESLLNLSK